jgi:hypothetical protein
MERDAPIGIGNGTTDGHAGGFVEESLAHDKGRTPALLLVPG